MKRGAILLPFVLILLIIMTGCWSRRELNNLAFAGVIGIDKAGDDFEVSVLVMDPNAASAKKQSGGRSPSVLYHARGETVPLAIRRMAEVTPRHLYFSHIRMLIFGEKLARDGIRDTLDFLSRNKEIRTDFYFAIAKGTTARELLGVITPLETLSANTMFGTLEVSRKTWAPTVPVQLDSLMSDLISEGKHPVLSTIQILGSSEQAASKNNLEKVDTPGMLHYTGLAVMKKDKLLGWLNEEESKSYNFIEDKVMRTIGVVGCPDGGNISAEVIRSKTELKGTVVQGQPQISIHIRIEQNIQDVECKIDFTKKETIDDLDKRANQKLEAVIKHTIESVQKKYKVDIFGFGEVIHRADPKAWKKLKTNWDEEFTNLPVQVTADVKTLRLGTVSNSVLQQMKE
jgi:spore germination protein KC